MDTFGRNDLIGSYTFDALWVFYQKDHEIYRRWIGLVDERNPEDRGIQGYLQCSISIVEPGGRIKTHDRAAEQEPECRRAKGLATPGRRSRSWKSNPSSTVAPPQGGSRRISTA